MTITSVQRPSESDNDLAARFAREAEPLFDVLSRGARRLTRSDADAEDLLQDALLHAYSGFHTFQEGTNLKAWLFRILYNRWVSTSPSPSRAARRRSRSTRSPSGTWPKAPRDCPRATLRRGRGAGCVARQRNQSGDGRPAGQYSSGPRCITPTCRATPMRRPHAIMNIPPGTVMSRVHVAGSGCGSHRPTSTAAEETSPLPKAHRVTSTEGGMTDVEEV